MRGSGDDRRLILHTDDTGDMTITIGNAAMGEGLFRTLKAELNHHLTADEQATIDVNAIMAALRKL